MNNNIKNLKRECTDLRTLHNSPQVWMLLDDIENKIALLEVLLDGDNIVTR